MTLRLPSPEFESDDEDDNRSLLGNLCVLNGATQREYPLYEGENVIGRSGDDSVASVQIDCQFISIQHAKIELKKEGNATLEDFGSSSGSFLNKRSKKKQDTPRNSENHSAGSNYLLCKCGMSI
eukprot:m.715 g.715  ORF g.715 m.715 type:complete len:124 (-) comp563_c0_seq1:255-626(-)